MYWATTFILTALAASASATLDLSSNNNLVVYWGQGPNQQNLDVICQNPDIDVINIGFLNVFPDQAGSKGWPGTNFGNQCPGDVYHNPDTNNATKLLKNCPFIPQGMKACQSAGKKVLLSLGGASPSYFVKEEHNEAFADFIWKAFGPVQGTYSDADPYGDDSNPRPFSDAVVDGFDFDIESAVPASEMQTGYSTMINRLRTLFDQD